MEKTYFEVLNSVDVSAKIEKKNGLSYLSWAWAWEQLKTKHADATYTVYESPKGNFYFDDGKTAWVKTGVTVNGLEHIEYLPIMDFKNKSIPVDSLTSFDANKAIQRSLTKAIARHGLGLYIYAGEDLPSDADEAHTPTAQVRAPKPVSTQSKTGNETAGDIMVMRAELMHQACLGANASTATEEGKVLVKAYMKKHWDMESIAKADEICIRDLHKKICGK